MPLPWTVWGKVFKFFSWVGRTSLAQRYAPLFLKQGEFGYGYLQLDILR